MGLGTRLSGTELTFLSGPGATSGTAHRQGLLLSNFHNHMMHAYLTTRWSILTGPCQMAIVGMLFIEPISKPPTLRLEQMRVMLAIRETVAKCALTKNSSPGYSDRKWGVSGKSLPVIRLRSIGTRDFTLFATRF